MPLPTDLLEVTDVPVYHIDYENMKIVEEKLVPVCQTDWTWYSNIKDAYLLETDVFENKNDALETLLGYVIAVKKDVILSLFTKEKEIIEQMTGPEYINEGLIG